MRLSVQERFALLDLLPQQGDYMTLKIVRQLREELSFSEEEHEALKFSPVAEGRVTWESSADPLKEFAFGRTQERVIKDVLEKVDKAKNLKMDHFSVYEKFFPEEEPEKPVRINGRKPVKANA